MTWRRRGPYFTEADLQEVATEERRELHHSDPAKILNDAAWQFLVAFDQDHGHMQPSEIAGNGRAIEHEARGLLRALGLPVNTTSAHASSRTLAKLAWWHGLIGAPRQGIPVSTAVEGVIMLRMFGQRLAEKYEGRRGTRHGQHGLDSFVKLMMLAYAQIFGHQPKRSRRVYLDDDGEELSADIGGPFPRFMSLVAERLAGKLDAEDPTRAALAGWAAGDTLSNKFDSLKKKSPNG